MQRMRVLWLVKGLGPGGAETLLLSTARAADHTRFEYHAAYALPWKNHLVGRLESAGVSVHCLEGAHLTRAGWVLRLRSLLLRGRYDVLHLHSPLVAGVARLVVRTLPRSARPAVVSTEHNTWWSFSKPTRWLNALLYRHDAARFAVSTEIQETIFPHLRPGVEVLVHGLVLGDVDAIGRQRTAARRELGIGDDDVVIGTVANLRTQKGYPVLLAAAAEVVAKAPQALFLAVGQGPLEDEVRERRDQLGLGQRFRLLGYREDVPHVLSACDVFVLASLNEGFPVALMEALAAGLPLVATAVGGIPDAVTDGVEGFLVPPSRPDLLAERLLRLVTDAELRAQLGEAARATGQQFDIGVAVRRLEQVYDQVAQRRGG